MTNDRYGLLMREAQAEAARNVQWVADLVPVLRRAHPDFEFSFKPYPLLALVVADMESGMKVHIYENLFRPYPFTEIKQAIAVLRDYSCTPAQLV